MHIWPGPEKTKLKKPVTSVIGRPYSEGAMFAFPTINACLSYVALWHHLEYAIQWVASLLAVEFLSFIDQTINSSPHPTIGRVRLSNHHLLFPSMSSNPPVSPVSMSVLVCLCLAYPHSTLNHWKAWTRYSSSCLITWPDNHSWSPFILSLISATPGCPWCSFIIHSFSIFGVRWVKVKRIVLLLCVKMPH